MRAGARAALAGAVAVVTAVTGQALTAASAAAQREILGPQPVTVVVDIEHSRFTPSSVPVAAGTTVRFVVVNHDPINHELIVGPQAVHDRHRDGTERRHAPVPGEVSVPALERAVTTYTFDAPGRVEMACHLPGHYEYGMRGAVEVVRR